MAVAYVAPADWVAAPRPDFQTAKNASPLYPELVRQLITLATTVADNSDATHAGWLLNMLSSGIAPMGQVSTRHSDVGTCPMRFVYSKTDGIVAWEACVSTESTNHRNIEVEYVSHLGRSIIRKCCVVAGLLAQHRDGPEQVTMRAAGR